jgi:hypothetical protein
MMVTEVAPRSLVVMAFFLTAAGIFVSPIPGPDWWLWVQLAMAFAYAIYGFALIFEGVVQHFRLRRWRRN